MGARDGDAVEFSVGLGRRGAGDHEQEDGDGLARLFRTAMLACILVAVAIYLLAIVVTGLIA